jgi:16S rRNA (cytidine1402-2'-O)-methyltransferase
MAALSAAGFESPLVHFAGFPPTKGSARARWFAEAAGMTGVLVLYEAPHRIRNTLQDLLEIVGDREAAVGRELTKLHESLVVRPISGHLGHLGEPRGEYTVVVRLGGESAGMLEVPVNSDLLHEFCYMTNTKGASRRDAVRSLAAKYGRSTRDIYERLERGKDAGD